MIKPFLRYLKGHVSTRPAHQKYGTSLSDNQRYPQACLDAANNFETFNNFRRNPAYLEILEHVTPELGKQYLDQIRDKRLIAAIPEIKKNDLWGNPHLAEYPSVGAMSPTTLRYIKVLQDLMTEVGDLNNLKICEIGVGYGGQCRAISSLFKPAKYTLVDLKPALLLAQRYLDHFPLPAQLEFLTMNECAYSEKYDLVISNYAFTELPRSVQDIYLQKIILKARHGYITYNEITPEDFDSIKQAELLRYIKKARILPEVPLTHPKNSIIVW